MERALSQALFLPPLPHTIPPKRDDQHRKNLNLMSGGHNNSVKSATTADVSKQGPKWTPAMMATLGSMYMSSALSRLAAKSHLDSAVAVPSARRGPAASNDLTAAAAPNAAAFGGHGVGFRREREAGFQTSRTASTTSGAAGIEAGIEGTAGTSGTRCCTLQPLLVHNTSLSDEGSQRVGWQRESALVRDLDADLHPVPDPGMGLEVDMSIASPTPSPMRVSLPQLSLSFEAKSSMTCDMARKRGTGSVVARKFAQAAGCLLSPNLWISSQDIMAQPCTRSLPSGPPALRRGGSRSADISFRKVLDPPGGCRPGLAPARGGQDSPVLLGHVSQSDWGGEGHGRQSAIRPRGQRGQGGPLKAAPWPMSLSAEASLASSISISPSPSSPPPRQGHSRVSPLAARGLSGEVMTEARARMQLLKAVVALSLRSWTLWDVEEDALARGESEASLSAIPPRLKKAAHAWVQDLVAPPGTARTYL